MFPGSNWTCQVLIIKDRNTLLRAGSVAESRTGRRGKQEMCVTVWLV